MRLLLPIVQKPFECFRESLLELRGWQLLLDTINIGNDQLLWDFRKRLIQTVCFPHPTLDLIAINGFRKQLTRNGNQNLVFVLTLIGMRHEKYLEGVQIKRGTLFEEFLYNFLAGEFLIFRKRVLPHELNLINLERGDRSPETISVLFVLNRLFAGNSKLLPAILPAVSEYTATIGTCHTLTKSVLVLSFSA